MDVATHKLVNVGALFHVEYLRQLLLQYFRLSNITIFDKCVPFSYSEFTSTFQILHQDSFDTDIATTYLF